AHSVLPPDDFSVCPHTTEESYFAEVFNDGGNYAWNDALALQPFDFANRTATLNLDLDAKTADAHSWWTEVWLTDLPDITAHHGAPPSAAYPHNALALLFANSCGQPTRQMTLYQIVTVANYVPSESFNFTTN